MLTSVLDTLLDRTVVPGYSRLGYAARRRWWAADLAPDALRGKVVAITGANSGLGKAAALGAARLGAEVRLLCRDAGRGASARAEIRAELPDADLSVDQCDLGSLAAVRDAADRLRESCPHLHALVHNAGVLPPERTETVDGHELTLATHVLGPHLLTALLQPVLSAGSRVVWVSSGGMYTQRVPIEDLEYRTGSYRGATAYARTKRMQVVLAERWADELAPGGIAVHSMHPGWAATPGIQDSLPGFDRALRPILRSPGEGADTIVWLLGADLPTGRFWHDRAHRTTSYLPFTATSAEDAQRLWDFCVLATGATRLPR